jgi:hypothetical protein
MSIPEITRKRILIAYGVAIVADLIEFPIAALELTVIGAPVAMFLSFVLDALVFGILTMLLGFHWLFLPSFLVKVVPGLDMLPTWVGCVFFVVRQRKKRRPLCLGDLKIQLRLADGFIAGVEQRDCLGAIPGAGAFLFSGFSVFDVKHAAAFAAVKDVTTFHSFRLSVRSYETERGFGCISYTKRAANPVIASDCRVLPG